MVNFQIASDLHIEMFEYTPKSSLFINPKAQVLILAGDIGRVHKYEQLKEFLEDVCDKFTHVLYVLGNHEYYTIRHLPERNMEQILYDMNKIKKDIPNLHILNRSSVLIDNVCISGCTLWSNPQGEVPNFIVRIPGITTKKYKELHEKDLHYIESMIEYCQKKKYKLLVITHHPPTYDVTQVNRNKEQYKFLYASHLDDLLVPDKVHTWVCGHVHKNFDKMIKHNGKQFATRLVSNQKGKPKDCITDFSFEKVIVV